MRAYLPGTTFFAGSHHVRWFLRAEAVSVAAFQLQRHMLDAEAVMEFVLNLEQQRIVSTCRPA